MKQRKKRIPLRTRKYKALRMIITTCLLMFLINHIMHIGVLLPRQAYHKLEERAGTGWTQVVKRDWSPEIYKTHIVYLSGNETATLFGSVNWSLYGWMPNFGVSLDCTKEAPLYAGHSFMYREDSRAWYFFGRVDDPEIETVTVSLCSEEYDNMSHAYIGQEVRRVTTELIEKGGNRYFFVCDDGTWDNEAYSSPRPIAIGYDGAGVEVIRIPIEEGNFSSFG